MKHISESLPDPHFPQNSVRERQEQKAWENSLGNGPWKQIAEEEGEDKALQVKQDFQRAVENYAKMRGYKNPGGYAWEVLKNMNTGERSRLWDDWINGNPLGYSDLREWEEMSEDGSIYPNPEFEAWLEQQLNAPDLSQAQVNQQIANTLRNPEKAKVQWDSFQEELSRVNQEKERMQKEGVNSYPVPQYITRGQKKRELKKGNVVEFPTEKAKQIPDRAPAVTPEEGNQPKESWADQIKRLIDTERRANFQYQFHRQAIHDAIAKQGDPYNEISELIVSEFTYDYQKAIFDSLLENPKTRRWAQENYPEHIEIAF